MNETELNPAVAEPSDSAPVTDDAAPTAAAPETVSEPEPLPGAGDASEDMFSQELLITDSSPAEDSERARLRAVIEAVVYITDEPLSAQQIAAALSRPLEKIQSILDELVADYSRPERGLSIREVAGGFKMATKPEHHEDIRAFVRNLKPPLRLSLAALETLAVIAYKQPVTAPEIMEIRGVQGAGVLRTLLDRKLIAAAGRKNVVGKPILYKTTKEFLIQFGLRDVSELPTLKEFEELGRLALTDSEIDAAPETPPPSPEAQADGDPGSAPPPVEEPEPQPGPEGDPPPAEPPREEPPAPAEPAENES
jgi:segregation and condensation protein B